MSNIHCPMTDMGQFFEIARSITFKIKPQCRQIGFLRANALTHNALELESIFRNRNTFEVAD